MASSKSSNSGAQAGSSSNSNSSGSGSDLYEAAKAAILSDHRLVAAGEFDYVAGDWMGERRYDGEHGPPPPRCLGGLPAGGDDGEARASNNLVPAHTSYGRLPRLPASEALPQPRGSDFASRYVEEAYRRIYGGDFFAAWYEVQDGRSLTVCAHLRDGGGNDGTAGLLAELGCESETGRLMVIRLAAGEDCGQPDMKSQLVIMGEQNNRAFHAAMTERQRTALGMRILHLLIRSQGASLGKNILSLALNNLRGAYSRGGGKNMGRGRWKEMLDLAIIGADCAFNQRLDVETIDHALVAVGEALESEGRYREAAAVYEDIVREELYRPGRSVAQLHGYAALAHKRAGNFEVAEREYIRALSLDIAEAGAGVGRGRGRGTWDVNSKENLNIANMTVLYNNWMTNGDGVEGGGRQRALRRETTEAETVGCIFVALLTAAGYDGGWCAETRSIAQAGVHHQRTLLKNNVRTAKHAKKALLSALRAPATVETFRAGILACKKADQTLFNFSPIMSSSEKAKNHKRDSRKVIGAGTGQAASSVFVFCSNPKCRALETEGGPTFKRCPCKSSQAIYCQKTCQIAHWHEHKLTCSHRAKKG